MYFVLTSPNKTYFLYFIYIYIYIYITIFRPLYGRVQPWSKSSSRRLCSGIALCSGVYRLSPSIFCMYRSCARQQSQIYICLFLYLLYIQQFLDTGMGGFRTPKWNTSFHGQTYGADHVLDVARGEYMVTTLNFILIVFFLTVICTSLLLEKKRKKDNQYEIESM